MTPTSTIYAVSSGVGRAGIAVVRVSGRQANLVLTSLVGTCPSERRASLRDIHFEGDLIDRAMVLWFPGPNTATGEDLAEFHVHGSSAVLARLFTAFNSFDGVVPAEAGDFTRRAFDNGRLDLTEVEGLADLLAADGEAQRRLAMRQFVGENSKLIEGWRERVVNMLALLEAAIDFAEDDAEIDAVGATAAAQVSELIGELQAALDQSVAGIGVRNGLKLVLAGAPNVGKSSLFNWLLRREAAIVSAQAGTTRDVVSSNATFAGLPVMLADTAGLRDGSSDEIEMEGMARSRSEISDADVLVWVRAVAIEDLAGLDRKPDIVVMNKSDLVSGDPTPSQDEIWVSVRNGFGLERLREKITSLITDRYARADHAILVRERHRSAVERSIRYLNDFLVDDEKSDELRAEDLRSAARELAMITGRVDVEDLLGRIFAEFCIGK